MASIAKLTSKSYDKLYQESKDGILWGDQPGRLILLITHYLNQGVVLDAGCGDGKNALYLERLGFSVVGIDYSSIALSGLDVRFRKAGWNPKGKYEVKDIRDVCYNISFDCLVSYGLFHCLPKPNRVDLHQRLQRSVRKGGIVLFSSLLCGIDLPTDHGTVDVELAERGEVEGLFQDWTILHHETGIIHEEHPPTAKFHQHSAVWIIARRN